MYYYVYLATNGYLFYIGKRSSKVEPEVDCLKYKTNSSHKKFKSTIKKLIVLKTFKTNEECTNYEIYLHEVFDVKNHPMYANKANQTTTGFDRTGVKLTKSHKNKVSRANKGKKHSEETKAKMSAAHKGRKVTLYMRQRASEVHSGKTISPKHKDAISEKTSGSLNGNFNHTIYTYRNVDTGEEISEVISWFYKNSKQAMGISGSTIKKLRYYRGKVIKSWVCL